VLFSTTRSKSAWTWNGGTSCDIAAIDVVMDENKSEFLNRDLNMNHNIPRAVSENRAEGSVA
jgi:hypothetical protein